MNRLLTAYRVMATIVGVLLVVLCLAVVLMLYRSPSVQAQLSRPATRLTFTRQGITWREVPPVPGWLLTARVSAFTYSPLMLVPSLVAIGVVADGRVGAIPAIVVWFAASVLVSYAVLFTTFFLVRHKRWARPTLATITVAVLVLHLPLCWYLLGPDGLVRDGGPVLVAAATCLYGLWRAPHLGS